MKLPRVTEILQNYTGYEFVPKNVLENAANRGTAVHAICAGIARGAFIPEAMIAEEYAGYVDSFRKWQIANVKAFEIIEKRYHDEERGFTGQVDFVVVCNDEKRYLVDIKTTAKPYRTHNVQLGAYTLLLNSAGVAIDGCMLVYLDRTADFPNVVVLESTDKEKHIFQCALECYKYFHGKRNEDVRDE